MDVNCGAISDSLIESELFGYDKGTLFLDEIGEIPIHLQVKHLRFLEGGKLVKVGGVKSIKLDTRIIAATNRNLEEMIENGSFKSDLYFRLNVVSLRIPPLSKRRERTLDH